MTEEPMKKVLLVLLAAGALLVTGTGTAGAGDKASSLKDGRASGLVSGKGKTTNLKYAYAFVAQDDERKAVILLLTDTPVPAEHWEREFDMFAYKAEHHVNGIAFWLDPGKAYKAFRMEFCAECPHFWKIAPDMFELKFDAQPGKAFIGTASMAKGAATIAKKDGYELVGLDATFNVSLK
jgi:hypothetical protein